MTEHDRLIEKLHNLLNDLPLHHKQKLADFILEDRLRIVEPLVKLKSDWYEFLEENTYRKAIDETIKLSGIEEPKDTYKSKQGILFRYINSTW